MAAAALVTLTVKFDEQGKPPVPRMMKLEQLQPNAAVHGIVPDALVTVVNVQWSGPRRWN